MGILMISKLKTYSWNVAKLFSLVFISFLCVSGSKIQIDDKLVGNWQATDYWNNTSDFIVTEEKLVTLSIQGQRFGGNDFQMNGNDVELKYSINDSQTPIWLDLIASDKKSGAVLLKVKGIIEFESYNKAKILLNLDNKRFTHFDKKYDKMMITIER